VYSINGERIFLKGANLAPTRAMLGDATDIELRRDIELAREAGLDLVRIHGHISRPELYDAADELGMLVWQDFPLQWGYARQIRREAVRQAEEAVNLLGHHPSIMTWCAHNEPFTFNVTPGQSFDIKKMAIPFLAGHQLPTWNKSVLDRWVKRSFEKADVTRPVIAHSGVLPHLPTLDGTDSHLYFGWYHGDERDLPGFAAKIPRLMRFVSEFGAQAIPESSDFIDSSAWPVLDWENLEYKFGMQRGNFENHVPVAEFDSFDDWRLATQVYQADVIRYHIETLRRLKYRPTGGFCMFALNDAMPMISWSVLDHQRVPKLGYTALAEACRPVIVTADRLPLSMRPGDQLRIALHVVSDLHRELENATVTATVESIGDPQVWKFEGAIGADDCTLVGHITITAPFAEGPMVLDLTLVSGDVVATNRYRTTVIAN
jgi:beta-mannosidase